MTGNGNLKSLLCGAHFGFLGVGFPQVLYIVGLKVAQAVTDTKLEELTREVRAHNGFAQRLPVLEEQMRQVVVRVDRIENYNREGK